MTVEERPHAYSPKTAARVLGLSESSLNRLIRSGELRAVRIGQGRGNVRITPAEIDRFLTEAKPVISKKGGA